MEIKHEHNETKGAFILIDGNSQAGKMTYSIAGPNKIIIDHSANADLTFLGLPPVKEGQEKEFVERADKLYKGLGTLVLVKASSFFSVLSIGE